MSVPPSTPRVSTRNHQSVLVISVIICILWAAVPQAQELIWSLIVLNSVWLAQASIGRMAWVVPFRAADVHAALGTSD